MVSFMMKTLIKNFFLMAYADIFNKRHYDMVGIGSDNKQLLIYAYDDGEDTYKQKLSHFFDKEIYTVIPCDLESNGNTSLLITFKEKEDEFANVFVNFSKEDGNLKLNINEIENTMSVPFLFTNWENSKPAFFLETHKETKMLCISDGKLNYVTLKNLLKENETLKADHTSTFVDLTGNLQSDLCLFVKRDESTWLKVFESKANGFHLLFEIELTKNKIGPVLFGDFTSSGMNSMIFVEDEPNGSIVNLYINKGKREDSHHYKSPKVSLEATNVESGLFSKDSTYHKRIPISRFYSNSKAILNLEELNNIPGGIFTTDIDLDGMLEIFLVIKNEKSKKIILPLKFNDISKSFVLYEEMNESLQLEDVISFSSVDFRNKGKEDIIVNIMENGSPSILCYENTLNKANMKLSLTTSLLQKGQNKYGMSLPGISYMLIFNDGNNLKITSNFGSGPFLHLNSQTTTIGLGDSAFMINILRIGVSEHNKHKDIYFIDTSIIQNFDLIIYIGEYGKYKIVAFFNTSEYTFKILIVLITVISVNLLFLLILYWRQNKYQKIIRSRESTHPLFRSL